MENVAKFEECVIIMAKAKPPCIRFCQKNVIKYKDLLQWLFWSPSLRGEFGQYMGPMGGMGCGLCLVLWCPQLPPSCSAEGDWLASVDLVDAETLIRLPLCAVKN